jgi:site-specific DNA recombinase
VAYIRVSTEDQGDRYGPDAQRHTCRELAKQRGLTINEEIQDQISGTVLQRPGLDQLRELVRAGSVEAVVVYAADRLSRDSIDLKILKILKRELEK